MPAERPTPTWLRLFRLKKGGQPQKGPISCACNQHTSRVDLIGAEAGLVGSCRGWPACAGCPARRGRYRRPCRCRQCPTTAARRAARRRAQLPAQLPPDEPPLDRKCRRTDPSGGRRSELRRQRRSESESGTERGRATDSHRPAARASEPRSGAANQRDQPGQPAPSADRPNICFRSLARNLAALSPL